MFFPIQIAILAFLAGNVESAPSGNCVIDLDERRGEMPPLLWSKRSNTFLWPERQSGNKHRLIDLDVGEEFYALCHAGSEKYPTELKGFGTSVLSLQCGQDGNIYKSERSSEEVEVARLTCTDHLEPSLEIEEGVACANESINSRAIKPKDLSLIKVGWTIDNKFVEQYRVCQDTKRYITLWTEHILEAGAVSLRDVTPGRPSFTPDVRSQRRTFLSFDSKSQLATCFTKKWQVRQVTAVLGKNEVDWNHQDIIDTSRSATNYFARGHLSPDAGFVYDPLQDATYFFFNAAHQFQSFNNGYWKSLEMAARDIAAKRDHPLTIWTGTYGVVKFRDIKGKLRSLNMFTENSKKFLPVPLYYWKVIYDKSANEAVAVIGVNNPFLEEGKEPKPLCKSVCDQVSWVDWIREGDSKLMYCCKVEDLKKAIDYVPDLGKNEPNLLMKEV